MVCAAGVGSVGSGCIVLGIGYQGERECHLPYHYELNQGLPCTGMAAFSVTGCTASTMAYTYGLTSNYNALQVNLTKRMGHGLQFQGAYTWSSNTQTEPVNIAFAGVPGPDPIVYTRAPRGQHFLRVVGRMRAASPLAQARRTSTASPRRFRASSRTTALPDASTTPSACRTTACGRCGPRCWRCSAASRSCC